MEKFLTFTIVGLTCSDLRRDRERPGAHVHDDRHLQLRPRRLGMLAAFAYWQLRFGVGLADARGACSSTCGVARARCSGCILEVVVMRGLRGTTEATKLVVSISLLLAMIGLAQRASGTPGVGRTDRTPFFHGKTIHLGPDRRSRGTRPSPSAWRSWWRSACGSSSPGSGWASRCAPRSTTPRWPRSTAPARTAWRSRLGHRHLARRARRHPRLSSERSARRPGAHAAHRQRLRRRDLRAAAQPAAHVRRAPSSSASPRATSRGYLPQNAVPPRRCASRPRPSCCSSCCWSCPTGGCAAARPAAVSTSRCRRSAAR